MKHLRTLNVRTMPQFDPNKSVLPLWNNMQSQFADTVVSTLIDTQQLRSRPPLNTLAIRALKCRDVRNGLGRSIVHDEGTYKYCRIHIYDIDRLYRLRGRVESLAILREAGTYEKTQAAGHCVKSLKPYPLG